MFEVDAVPNMYPITYLYTSKNFFSFEVRTCDEDVGLALSNDIGITDRDTLILWIGQNVYVLLKN